MSNRKTPLECNICQWSCDSDIGKRTGSKGNECWNRTTSPPRKGRGPAAAIPAAIVCPDTIDQHIRTSFGNSFRFGSFGFTFAMTSGGTTEAVGESSGAELVENGRAKVNL